MDAIRPRTKPPPFWAFNGADGSTTELDRADAERIWHYVRDGATTRGELVRDILKSAKRFPALSAGLYDLAQKIAEISDNQFSHVIEHCQHVTRSDDLHANT